jgi:hypothetical protein|tara:strand:+ start:436 stop:594 length:159 start_codon:yes stop_codon:yes gene_type:complete
MDKGFGDTFERFTKATGIHWLIMTLSRKYNIPCGCERRKELLNKWFPYGNNK